MMRKLLIIIIAAVLAMPQLNAQKRECKFDAKRFQASLEQFITKEAALTPREAASFFPVYREFLKKQRRFFDEMHHNRRFKPVSEAECREAIQKRDEADLQMKELQKQYHNKFLKILPASKVYDIIRAEDRFHRQSFKKAAEQRRK